MKKYFLFLGVIVLISLSSSSANAQSRTRASTQKTQTKAKTKAELQKELKSFSKAYLNKTAAAKKMSTKVNKPTQSKHQKVKTNKMKLKDTLNACIDGCLDEIAGKGDGNSAAICADLCDCLLSSGGLECAVRTVQKVKK